jgi:5-methylcytosine-specific restriction endonuclease McrA
MPKKKKSSKDYKKQHIPKALREQCWVHNFGKIYEHKCYIKWCSNKITVFDFHVGHNIPECKGGKLCLENVKPICSRCNHSMGSQYTITEWMKLDENIKQPTCCTIS